MTSEHEHFMDLCLAESRKAWAEGNSPIAAAVVRDGSVVGLGRNVVSTACDPTAHAEVEAIRAAGRSLGATDLTGCTLYSPLEPCPMCCGALLASGVSRLMLGARNASLGRRVHGNYVLEDLVRMTGRPLEIVEGVRTAECEALRRDWEAERRRAAGG